jgi:hypothetical protein
MELSSFRNTVRRELNGFAWDQWAQLGVFAPTPQQSQTAAADPEALLLFSLELGRDDPRLFDEVLDWILANEALISVHRLRNLCIDRDDRALADGALGWATRWPPKVRPRSAFGREPATPELRPLFRDSRPEVASPDPAFMAAGFLKPDTEPSRKTRPLDPRAPIAFALRMRLMFGVGSRAEVIRFLLTNPSNDGSVQWIAEAAGYAKRNVSETLNALADAGVLLVYDVGNEYRYALFPEAWNELLAFESDVWPRHRDWRHLLQALRRLNRWLANPQLDELSPYLLASEARRLAATMEADLNLAGIATASIPAGEGERYWGTFVRIVEQALLMLYPYERPVTDLGLHP